ncbi:hypothetical protein MJO29_011729 [Puccinia striiformis f. sp. tritici]|nr:hypothetical protein Pst134EB_023292 [Puccinia striiformis f. sp. tritici]KAI7945341.1 hypothetical protein MJO29_011729 [Puccinia striiformis f. sp. tritici]
MAEPNNPPQAELAPQEVRDQADLVLQSFESLRNKCNPYPDPPCNRQFLEEVLSHLFMDNSTWEERLLNWLQLFLLPALHRRLIAFSLSLYLPALQKAPESQLKLVLRDQKELEGIIYCINVSLAAISPESMSSPSRVDDQNLERLKAYRLHNLRAKFAEASEEIFENCQLGSNLIDHIKLSPAAFNLRGDVDFMGDWFTLTAVEAVEAVIGSITGSDLDVAQNCWKDDLEEIDSMLWGIETVAKPGTYVGYEGQRPIRKLAREPVIKLAYMAIGIIKLAKLFFKKLSRRGMATKRFPVVTTMCSEQISILAQLVGQVARDIMKLLALLTQAEANDPAATSHEFIQVAKDIKSRFDLPLLVVANHLIPAIPDTDRLQDRDYFKNWFMSWDTELTCATEKLIQVATLLDDDPA